MSTQASSAAPGSQGKMGKCPGRVHVSYTPSLAQHVSSVNTHMTVACALIHTSGKPVVSFSPSILAVGHLQPLIKLTLYVI